MSTNPSVSTICEECRCDLGGSPPLHYQGRQLCPPCKAFRRRVDLYRRGLDTLTDDEYGEWLRYGSRTDLDTADHMERMSEALRDAGRKQCGTCLAYYEAALFDACPDCTVERPINEDARQVRDDYARAVGAPR